MKRSEAILIAGPTASGKSRLARELASRFDGVIVNADSMQVYSGLSILTARPTADDERQVPHRLYGHVPPSVSYSVGTWLSEVETALSSIREDRKLPIICGGTGLYFRALFGGLDDMPAVPEATRARWRERMAAEGPRRLHQLLAERDPRTAASLRPADSQRITRALEVIDATGQPLIDLREGGRRPLVEPASCQKVLILPDRAVLRERISKRVDAMVEAGVLNEVRAFLATPGAEGSAASKAIGVREFAAAIRGELSLPAAMAAAVTRTRQYAKRQVTWFRHQLDPSWQVFADADQAAAVKI